MTGDASTRATGRGLQLFKTWFFGWARPAPWLLALFLVGVLMLVWAVAVRGLVRAGAWAAD